MYHHIILTASVPLTVALRRSRVRVVEAGDRRADSLKVGIGTQFNNLSVSSRSVTNRRRPHCHNGPEAVAGEDGGVSELHTERRTARGHRKPQERC